MRKAGQRDERINSPILMESYYSFGAMIQAINDDDN